jgi:hypothetical protein
MLHNEEGADSSVSLVPDYRLDERGLIPASRKNFSHSLWVQTGFGFCPAFHPTVPGVFSTGLSEAGTWR